MIDTLADKIINNVADRLKDTTPNLMTVSQLAQYLGVSKAWIYQKTFRKQIPVRKVGGLRFLKGEIDEWFNLRKG